MSNTICERAVRAVENASVVALDLETTGLNPRRDRIRLVQVSDGEKIFVIDLFRRDGRPLFVATSGRNRTALVGPFLAASVPGLPRAPREHGV